MPCVGAPEKTRLTEKWFRDPHNGERFALLEENSQQKRPPKPGQRSGFTMVWFEQILDDEMPPLPWSALKTFAALTRFHSPATGTIRYNLDEIGELSRITHTQQSSRNIALLIEANVLARVRRGEVMLNPDFAWIGDATSQTEARTRYNELKTEEITDD